MSLDLQSVFVIVFYLELFILLWLLVRRIEVLAKGFGLVLWGVGIAIFGGIFVKATYPVETTNLQGDAYSMASQVVGLCGLLGLFVWCLRVSSSERR